jgi:hypothetical protein
MSMKAILMQAVTVLAIVAVAARIPQIRTVVFNTPSA